MNVKQLLKGAIGAAVLWKPFLTISPASFWLFRFCFDVFSFGYASLFMKQM